MNAFINQLLLTVLLSLVSAIFMKSIVDPAGFGNWLKQVDDARFEYTSNE